MKTEAASDSSTGNSADNGPRASREGALDPRIRAIARAIGRHIAREEARREARTRHGQGSDGTDGVG